MKQIIIELKASSFKPQAKAGTFVTAKIIRGVPFKLYGEII
jgi:hypothetical protein